MANRVAKKSDPRIPATQRAAYVDDEGAPDPKRQRGPSSEAESGVVCIVGASTEALMSLQHCLMARAMALRPPDPQQDVCMRENEQGEKGAQTDRNARCPRHGPSRERKQN